jgi:chromate transporter
VLLCGEGCVTDAMTEDEPSEKMPKTTPALCSRTDASAELPMPPPHISFRTALLYWLKLGFISFGGPAGQIAIMHTELVERRRWISERRFLHALNYCMVLPGPEAQQLATYIGWLLHGTWGGIAAGALFVLPSLFILMALSWIYMAFGDLAVVQGVFYGVKPAVVAVVAFAVIRIGSRAVKNAATLSLAAAAFAALLMGVPFPLIIVGAGVLGYVGSKIWPDKFVLGGGHKPKSTGDEPHAGAIIDDHHEMLAHTRPNRVRFAVHLLVGLTLWALPMLALVGWQGWHGTHTQIGWFFTQAALVTFGGAYAVLPFVAQHALDVYHWLKPGQMIDGLALGETTPGPLIMVVAFVGFVGGWHQAEAAGASVVWPSAVFGCVVATYFTFLPSFLFILLGAPFVEQMRGELRLTAALSGITAAVVGVVLHLAVFFGQRVFLPTLQKAEWLATFHESAIAGKIQLVATSIDWLAVIIAAAAFVALWRFKADIVRVVLCCGAVGLVVRLFG